MRVKCGVAALAKRGPIVWKRMGTNICDGSHESGFIPLSTS
jgi:hypothetical protein